MRTRCPAFRTEPFEDIADAQFAADLLHVDGAALVGEAKLRAITNNQRIRESAVMIYSTVPCNSGSQLTPRWRGMDSNFRYRGRRGAESG
jgi:hypothetical protein